jgi:hypothetical protein
MWGRIPVRSGALFRLDGIVPHLPELCPTSLPDCAAIHKELKSRKNVTLQLLWEEYKEAYPLRYNFGHDLLGRERRLRHVSGSFLYSSLSIRLVQKRPVR